MSRYMLQLVTTGHQELDEMRRIWAACPSGLIDIVQIREKHRTARELVEWYETCRELLPGTKVFINDRIDVALAVGAPGVQLAYHSLSPKQARSVLPRHVRIGRSIHHMIELAEFREDADFFIYGHIFGTMSKPGLEPRGLHALEQMVKASPKPLIAIGGIDLKNIQDVLATGCSGVAVMSSVFRHSSPGKQVEALREAMERSNSKPTIAMEVTS